MYTIKTEKTCSKILESIFLRRAALVLLGFLILFLSPGCANVMAEIAKMRHQSANGANGEEAKVEEANQNSLSRGALKARLGLYKEETEDALQNARRARRAASQHRKQVWKLEDRVAELERKLNIIDVRPTRVNTEKISTLETKNKALHEKLSGIRNTQTRQEGKFVVVTMGERILFEEGKADLKPRARQTLSRIGAVLRQHPDRTVMIQGYTDNVPISTKKYPSNWQLSVARAVSVVEHLIQEQNLNPERLIAQGYGKYHPVAPNNTPANRQLNRRVEIVLYPPSTSLKRDRVSKNSR